MLEDASRQMQSNADEPTLYSIDDVLGAVQSLHLPPDNQLDLFRKLGNVELFDSGHILGSKMIMVEKDGFECSTQEI